MLYVGGALVVSASIAGWSCGARGFGADRLLMQANQSRPSDFASLGFGHIALAPRGLRMTSRLADRRRCRLRSLRAPPCYGLAASDFLLPDVLAPLQAAGFGLTLAYNYSFKPNPLRGSA